MHHPAMPRRPDALSPPRPLDALWQPRVLVWVLLTGEGLAAVLALAPGNEHGGLTYFGLASLLIQWIALLSLGVLYALRHLLGHVPAPRVAWVALAVLLASTLIVVTWSRLALGPTWFYDAGTGWAALAGRLALMALIVGLLGLAAFQNHWRARKAAVRTKQAELEALQARIRPHFLFNTLNTATALARQRPELTEQVLLDLSDLFRAALSGPKQILLSDELDLVKRYLEIEALRFGDRLRVDWVLPKDIPAVRVPALSIQPLVENAIRHGIERNERGGRVEIALSTTHEHVLVRVRNPLFLSDSARHASHGVGLSASQARIEALTAGLGNVETGIQGEHFVATVRLPRPRPANRRG